MKRCKILLCGFVLFFIVASNGLYAKEAAKTMDYAAAIAKAGADSKGNVTVATVNALMAEAAKIGAEAEVAMMQALMAAYPKQAAFIANTALGCCSKAAVAGIFAAALGYTSASSWSALQATALKANPAAAEAIAAAMKAARGVLKSGGGGSVSGGGGGISGFISGGNNSKNEDKASE